jgi:drug/metabolite transporter (DMT)-like permease
MDLSLKNDADDPVDSGVKGRLTLLGYGACALASCLWGTGFYWGRLALNEMGVGPMLLYRFLFASLVMLPVVILHRSRFHLSRSELRLLLICALLGVPIQFLLQYYGLSLTTVSHASLMVGSMPVMLAVAATLFARERLDRVGWLALVASTVGASLVALGGGQSKLGHTQATLAGDLLVVSSLVVALVWVLLSKKLMESHPPPVVTAYTILLGTGMLAVWVLGAWLLTPNTLSTGDPLPFAHLSATAWAALAISGLLCTAASTLLWNWGIHHVPASRAGVFLNLEPAIGSWLGVGMLGEHLGPYAWAGAALILAAAVTFTLRAHQPDPAILLE